MDPTLECELFWKGEQKNPLMYSSEWNTDERSLCLRLSQRNLSTLFVLTKTYFLSLTVVWMERNLEIKILMGNGECENLSSADNGEDIGMFVFGNIIKYSGEIFLRVIKCWISQNLFHFFLRFLGCGIEACFVKIHHKVLRLFLSSTTEISLLSLVFLCNSDKKNSYT